MSGPVQPLKHVDPETKDDAVLQDECDQHFAEHPVVQFMAELFTRLRLKAFSWWTPEQLRGRWSATDRMRWLSQRADLRQHTTTLLTGLAPRAGRQKDPDFQGTLVDSVIDCGDITALEFEDAFPPAVLAAYAPLVEYWRAFRESLPWDQDTPAHQELVAALIDELLASKSTLRAVARRPILTHWEVRTAIPSEIWNARVPLEVRAAIDDARMERERTRADVPFRAVDDLAIATPYILAAHIPLRVLSRVFDAAERSFGFASGSAAATARVAQTKSRASNTVAPPPATTTTAPATAPAAPRTEPDPAPKPNGLSMPVPPPPPPRASADGTAKRAALRLDGAGSVSVPLPGTNGKGAKNGTDTVATVPAPVMTPAVRIVGAVDEHEKSDE